MDTATAPTALGLTSDQAARRLAADGPNAVDPPRPRRLVGRVGRQLGDPLVLLLIAAAVITALLGDVPDTAVIVLVVLVNTVIGVVQEVRADAAIAALDRLAAPSARAVRDGHDRIVAAADLVRDDLVRLEAGDIVPADLALVEAHRATFDESSLTGESAPVSRTAGEEAGSGTVLTTGRATGVVVRTGARSSLGRIAALVAHTGPGATPLQRRLAALGRALGLAAVAISAVVFAAGVLAGQPVARMAITAVSLVVAAVPESLPAVVTLALALGSRRMARTRAIPRRLHAVETLGSVTVIASDKTGTLTENRMSVQRALTTDGTAFAVTGEGYAPTGTVTPEVASAGSPLRELALGGLLCNDAELIAPAAGRPEWAAAGDPMEAALVAFAARCGLDAAIERGRYPRVAEQPFDQDRRRMVTVHRRPEGGYLTVCKGAPESVLTADGPDQAAGELAAGGLRVLAVATAVTPERPDPADPPPLRVAGLVGIGDPLRTGAADTAAAFARSGVRLVLITGDHPATAAAIGRQLGILGDGDEVASGPSEVGARVYARVQPEEKLDIIAALQERGDVVAMTGDGVNDAPALRRADIGVAMGGGTEVARQAAELVLVDDNLGTVASAIGEGRRIYDNIRRFLRYALSGGIAELLVMLAGPLLGMPLALLPGQLLWINLLTHGIPGVALGAEPADAGVSDRPPRSPQQSVLGDGLLAGVILGGLCLGSVTLAAGVLAMLFDRPWQSVMFVVLGLAQLGVALAVRARPAAGTPRNRWLLISVMVCAVLQVGGVLAPPLRALLGTEALTWRELVACAVFAAIPALLLRATARWVGLWSRLIGRKASGAATSVRGE
ncbi:cation-translocating P-type ATPase [Paractinoplanes atraurantiacus]|uniref:Ca2+-transporting ATPase n=1 Tax=Paractinoplanes atraurantiacus TaxID=1036182 RepID=A0A285KIK3_9ACTN|nr:cation-transporting P-type ATPase [Actinoplanes atraurantiacus]SNY71131.1 Ca2+-transporting ATPase [Actinoplanes atraurantiacus]